jgi:outer membrane protein assembly factor BamB
VLVAGGDGVLRRFAQDGAVTDVYRAPAALTESPVSGYSEEILLVSADGVLRAVTSRGELRYERALGSTASGPPAASPDGNVYVATTGGKLLGVDREGKELFAFEPLGRPEAPSVGAGGTVFFGAEDTKVYAVQPSGRLLFAASLRKRALGAPALGGDGSLVVAAQGSVMTVGP